MKSSNRLIIYINSFILILSISVGNAQDSLKLTQNIRGNNISISPFPFLESNLNGYLDGIYGLVLGYEHKIAKKISLGANCGVGGRNYRYGSTTSNVWGLSISPEFRYYFVESFNKPVNNGFYIGFQSVFTYKRQKDDIASGLFPAFSVSNTVFTFNLAPMIGWQKVFQNGLSINLGTGYGFRQSYFIADGNTNYRLLSQSAISPLNWYFKIGYSF